MTREEAIEFGNMWLEVNEDCKDSSTYAFFQTAIKALKQEPCEDCISRQAAKLKVARVTWDDGDSCYDFHDKCVDCLDDVPPVTPQPETGHWVNIDATHSKCDRCDAIFEIASENGEANYCPNCGARMEVDG
jgi:hypothetical protein